MRRQGGLIAVIMLLSAATIVAIWLRQREYSARNSPPGQLPESSLPASVSEATPGTKRDEPTPSKAVGPLREPPADPEFQKWLSSEARQLDSVNVDGEAKQRELRKVVSKMTPNQSRQLLQLARNPRTPSAEKILSTFLLVESGARGHRELAELITSPLDIKDAQPAHSEGEMKGIRDKSLRIMGIDGLFSQAQKDPRAKDILARAIPSIDDPFVRAYAEDKLRQLR